MEAAAIAQYGAGIDTSNSSPLGKSIRATAVEIANRWNADRGVYYAAYIDFAYGTNLDACIAILNLPRNSAVYSTGEVVFTGTDSTLVPGNTVLTNPDLIRFKTTRDMTIEDVVTNGGFPSATTGWVAQNGAVLASVAGGSAGNCLQITGGGAIADPYADQTYTVIPGDIYDLSVLIKAGTEATYNVTVYDETNSANIYTTGDLEETAGDWSTSATTQLTIPTDCVSASIRVQQIALAAATTTMLFDTVSLTRVGVSTKAIVAGITGNVAADTIVLLESPISGITAVTNPSAITGGT
ncbi:MAG: baseplate J/gp47 family protein, partial [Gammaproteobacteria bacterium]|nr:baseplate J/gp47 family protein [Gammaproteobacteria bacterium]